MLFFWDKYIFHTVVSRCIKVKVTVLLMLIFKYDSSFPVGILATYNLTRGKYQRRCFNEIVKETFTNTSVDTCTTWQRKRDSQVQTFIDRENRVFV